MKNMKKTTKTLLLALGLSALPVAGSAEVVDRIVAVVNAEIILLSDLQKNAGPYEERAAQEATDPMGRALARKQVREKVLDDMIADKLVEEQAKELQITTTEREVDAEIARIKRENQLDDAEFAKQLQRQGMSQKAMREYLKRSKMRQKVLEVRVQPRVVIGDAEIRAYYAENFKNDDEVRVRMISKRIPQAASEAETKKTRAQVEAFRTQVTTGGKDFAAIAKVESEGPNPSQGGDLGWFKRGDVAPEIEEAAFALQSNEVSPVIELGGAYHIVQLLERRAAPAKPFEEVQERIRALLFNRAGEKEYDRWIAELKEKSFVEKRLDAPVPADPK